MPHALRPIARLIQDKPTILNAEIAAPEEHAKEMAPNLPRVALPTKTSADVSPAEPFALEASTVEVTSRAALEPATPRDLAVASTTPIPTSGSSALLVELDASACLTDPIAALPLKHAIDPPELVSTPVPLHLRLPSPRLNNRLLPPATDKPTTLPSTPAPSMTKDNKSCALLDLHLAEVLATTPLLTAAKLDS